MAFAAPALPFLIGGLAGGAVSSLLKPKAPKPVAQPPAMRTRSPSVATDALMARRGSVSNRRTGSAGVESSAGAKKTLMGN